jgi:aerobic-type carbon monoxide dehydrogenase small subunit (CoxS/CutS family)
MNKVRLKVNGVEHNVVVDADLTLLDLLREQLHLTGAKQSCDKKGQCGACMVIVDGKATRSCLSKVAKLDGADVMTVEGLGTPANPHLIQEAFVLSGAIQCGFCTPGMIMATKALPDENPDPSTEEIFGGTGIDSQSLCHTQSFSNRLEAGTLNLLGIIGLLVGIERVRREGLEQTHAREMALIRRLREGLCALSGVTVYSPPPRDGDLPVLTCNFEGLATDDVGAILDGDYGIAVRTGLHCAPLAHADLGTGEQGSVRFSLGHLNTEADIDTALEAMAAITGVG